MTTTLSPFTQPTQAPTPQMPLWAKQDQDKFNPEKAQKPLETGWVTIDQLDKGPVSIGKTESIKPVEKTPMKSIGSMRVDSSTINQEETNKATLKTIRANLARAVESVNPLSLLTSNFTKETAAATKEATIDLFKQVTGLGEKAKPAPPKVPDQKTIQIKINEQNRNQQEADQMKLANDKARKIQETATRLGVGGSNADIIKRAGLTGGEISIALINQVAKEDEEKAKKQKKNIISQIAASLSPKKNLGVNMDQGFEGKNIAQNLQG